MGELLTLQSIDARPILVPLRRPIVSKVGRFDEWPMILIESTRARASSATAIWSRI